MDETQTPTLVSVPTPTTVPEPPPTTDSILYSSHGYRTRGEYCNKVGPYLFNKHRQFMSGWSVELMITLIKASDSELEECNGAGLYNHVDMWLDIRAARDTAKCMPVK